MDEVKVCARADVGEKTVAYIYSIGEGWPSYKIQPKGEPVQKKEYAVFSMVEKVLERTFGPGIKIQWVD